MDSIETIATDHTTNASRRKKAQEPQRYQWFDQWLIAKPGPLKALVNNTIRFLEHHEDYKGQRKRARRAQDRQNHQQRVETIVCNLAHTVLLPPPQGRVAVPLGHGCRGRSRYDSGVLGKTLSPTLYALEETDFLELHRPSVMRGEVSSIATSAWFARKIAEMQISLADFDRREEEEIIILSRQKRNNGRTIQRERIDYTDTPTSRDYRDRLKRFNTFLRSADINFLDDGQEPRIDPFDRTLRRRFLLLPNQKEARFDQSGRLFGGFWQNLKSERRQHIRINGEQVAVLDYSSMFTRLAYAELGEPPPPGDLYAIPGFKNYRSGIKFAMSCFLFDGGRRRTWPSEVGIGVGDDETAKFDRDSEAAKFDSRLPFGATVAKTKAAILRVHPILERAWGRRLGYKLMFRESEIMMDVLTALTARSVPTLSLHDGLIVPASARELAAGIMAECALRYTGIDFPVAVKT